MSDLEIYLRVWGKVALNFLPITIIFIVGIVYTIIEGVKKC